MRCQFVMLVDRALQRSQPNRYQEYRVRQTSVAVLAILASPICVGCSRTAQPPAPSTAASQTSAAPIPSMQPESSMPVYGPPAATTSSEDQVDIRVRQLVDLLAGRPLLGPSSHMGIVAVQHNHLTRAIVALGSAAVPELVRSLPTADEHQATYIVFCLDELKAWSAAGAATELLNSLGTRFPIRGYTLEFTLKRFLTHAQEQRQE